MERCVFCQGELENGVCWTCGREQPKTRPSAPGVVPREDPSREQPAVQRSAPPVTANGPLPRHCPHCGEPAQSEDRFCLRCATPLRAPCPNCREEIPIWAAYCPRCAQPLNTAGKQASATTSHEVNIIPVIQTGESLAQPSSVPLAPATPQSGAPSVPGIPVGSQTASSSSPGIPAVPQRSVSSVRGAPAAPQSGAPSRASAPTGSQSRSPGMSAQGQRRLPPSLPPRPPSTPLSSGLGQALLGTLKARVITLLVVAAVIVASGITLSSLSHNPSSGGNTPSNNTPQPTGQNTTPPTNGHFQIGQSVQLDEWIVTVTSARTTQQNLCPDYSPAAATLWVRVEITTQNTSQIPEAWRGPTRLEYDPSSTTGYYRGLASLCNNSIPFQGSEVQPNQSINQVLDFMVPAQLTSAFLAWAGAGEITSTGWDIPIRCC